MKTFISNPKLSDNKFDSGLISLKEGEFYFSFSSKNVSNFDLSFIFQENDNAKSVPFGFSISNNDIGAYKNEYDAANKINYTYLTNIDEGKDIKFFEDTIRISESSPLSMISGKHVYLRSGSPSLNACKENPIDIIYDSDGTTTVEYILPKENEQIYSAVRINNSGKYKIRRKMDNKTSVFKNISSDELKYYYNTNNIFNSAKSYDWKIIIGQGGKELSVFSKLKEENTYTKRETILYNHNIENCYLKLIVGDEMILSNCSFRFFKTDIS